MSDTITDRRERWAQELESGGYVQAFGRLSDLNGSCDPSIGFCCLGVACELYMRETGIGYWTTSRRFVAGPISCMLSLPSPVANYFNVSHEEQRELTRMNDKERADFKVIACKVRDRSWRYVGNTGAA